MAHKNAANTSARAAFDGNFVRFFENLDFVFANVDEPVPDDSRLFDAMQAMRQSCDKVAFKSLPPLLVASLSANHLSNEALVGRFVLLEEKIATFREFAIRAGYAGKIAVVANIFVLFEDHSTCADFRLEAQALRFISYENFMFYRGL